MRSLLWRWHSWQGRKLAARVERLRHSIEEWREWASKRPERRTERAYLEIRKLVLEIEDIKGRT